MSRKPTPMPGSFLAPQQAFPTTEDAQASYGFAAPPLAGAAGEGEKPFDAERAQALRDDVRKKYEAALPRVLEAGRWFRIEAVLDEADAQAKELATLRARLAEETRAAAEAEREKLALREELRGLRAGVQAVRHNLTNLPMRFFKIGKQVRDELLALLPSSCPSAAAAGPLLGDEGKEGQGV